MAARFVEDLARDLDRLCHMGARPRELLTDPGAWALAIYRVGRTLRSLPRPLRLPLLALHRPWELLVRAVSGVELSTLASIGGGLYLGHIGGIRVDPGVHLGRDVNLSHGVQIAQGGPGGARSAPFVGDRVYLGPGTRVSGDVRIGNDAAVAANARVDRDVPDGAVVGAAPASVFASARSQRSAARSGEPLALQAGVRAVLRRHLPKPLPLLVGP